MFFSNRWMSHVRALRAQKDEVSYDDRVFIIADESGDMDGHMLRGKVTTPLFTHHGASSWHSWDAAVIVQIGKHYILIPMVFMFGLICLILSISKCMRVPTGRLNLARKSGISRKPDIEEAFVVHKGD